MSISINNFLMQGLHVMDSKWHNGGFSLEIKHAKQVRS